MAESRSVVKLFGVSALALVAMTGVALADGYAGSIKDAPAKPEREFTYSFSMTGTSDYVFRGISQSSNDPALQGAVNIGYGIFYAGIWGSNVDFWSTVEPNEHANVEIDYYAGVKPTWGPATFDFGVLWYTYPGFANKSDVVELKAGVSGEVFKSLTASAALYYSPDYNGLEYFVYEGTLAYALPQVWIFSPTLSGTIGKYDWDKPSANSVYDYTYWNVGLTLAVDKIAFDLRYWDTDASSSIGSLDCFGGTASTCGERFVASFTVTLP